ncbi:hypothetical protein [Halomarina rubra]|uniref:Uncharacterized protein n=1 Tax=Halomarina rubra TaxID=2071873 RepID=A0ABD6ATU6_9EURY|nr:hypothetical protein [Halomarina rubra]
MTAAFARFTIAWVIGLAILAVLTGDETAGEATIWATLLAALACVRALRGGETRA